MLAGISRRIRNYFAGPAVHTSIGQESSRKSCYLTGWFDFFGDHIAGWAENILEPLDRDLTVFVVRDQEVIASARVDEKLPTAGWHFTIHTGQSVTGDDILREKVTVLVRDAAGETQSLKLEGSTQLELIRELVAEPVAPFVQIDFREGGNSADFVMEGWSGQEKIHRWTVGVQSTLRLPTPPRNTDYTLQIQLWPFTIKGAHPEQRLQVLFEQIEIARFCVTQQCLLQCEVPSSALPDTPSVIVGFSHPDATTPASLGVGNDSRLLALAFKRLKLIPAVCSVA